MRCGCAGKRRGHSEARSYPILQRRGGQSIQSGQQTDLATRRFHGGLGQHTENADTGRDGLQERRHCKIKFRCDCWTPRAGVLVGKQSSSGSGGRVGKQSAHDLLDPVDA